MATMKSCWIFLTQHPWVFKESDCVVCKGKLDVVMEKPDNQWTNVLSSLLKAWLKVWMRICEWIVMQHASVWCCDVGHYIWGCLAHQLVERWSFILLDEASRFSSEKSVLSRINGGKNIFRHTSPWTVLVFYSSWLQLHFLVCSLVLSVNMLRDIVLLSHFTTTHDATRV